MTNVWLEGFELFQSIAAMQDIYTNTTFDAGVTFPAGRNGVGICIKAGPTNSTFRTPGLAAHASWYQGFAINATNPEDGSKILQILDGSNEQLALVVNDVSGGYTISVKRGAATIQTSTATLVDGQWYYVELGATINTSTGSVELKINQSTAAGFVAITGINTANAGTNTADRMALGLDAQAAGTTSVYLDDWYINNGAGSVNNTYWGDTILVPIYPDTDGDSSQWTPSTGSDHSDLVDEPTEADDDTTYVETASDGDVDLFEYTNLSVVSSDIFSVMIHTEAKLLAAGSRNIRAVHTHTDTTVSNGTTVAVNDTAYKSYRQVWELNPATGLEWTAADIDGAQIGFETVP